MLKQAKVIIASFLLRAYYQILIFTVRFEFVGREFVLENMQNGKSIVMGIIHASLLPVILAWDGFDATLLASQSKDGQIAAGLLEARGFNVVRGSSSRGGREALVRLVESARDGSVIGITFDGPRGPALVPKAGVAVCARAAAAGLVFTWVESIPSIFFGMNFLIRLGSWDRFMLPLPFAKFRIHHERLCLGESESDSALSEEEWIARVLEVLESRARAVYKG
jgi:lysophospholipid acyltransferase (LPLAT)-like uncharacterized protein